MGPMALPARRSAMIAPPAHGRRSVTSVMRRKGHSQSAPCRWHSRTWGPRRHRPRPPRRSSRAPSIRSFYPKRVTYVPNAPDPMRAVGLVNASIDPNAPLTLRFTNGEADGLGIVRLQNGRYRLRRQPGGLIAPNLYLFRIKARVAEGAGDKLTMRIGLATNGTTPAIAPEMEIAFGDAYRLSSTSGASILALSPAESSGRVRGRFRTAGGDGASRHHTARQRGAGRETGGARSLRACGEIRRLSRLPAVGSRRDSL